MSSTIWSCPDIGRMKEASITCNMSPIINQKDPMSFASSKNWTKRSSLGKQEIKASVRSGKNCLARASISSFAKLPSTPQKGGSCSWEWETSIEWLSQPIKLSTSPPLVLECANCFRLNKEWMSSKNNYRKHSKIRISLRRKRFSSFPKNSLWRRRLRKEKNYREK